MPSVIAMIVAMPASAASRIESAANARRHEDHRRVRAGLADRLREGVEDGDALDVLPALARRHAADDVGAVALVVERVERSLTAGDPGDAQPRLAGDDDAHAEASLASWTTLSAASFIVDAVCTFGRSASARMRLPSASLVPSSRTTKGTSGLICVEGLHEPVGDLVAARDAAEDVEEHGLDLLVGEDHLDGTGDRLGLRSAARVEEVRRLAAVLRDDVERAHDEPRAVAEDPDVAVELDVREAALVRHLLLWVLGARVAQLGVVRVAEQRVVVERDLGVERRDRALGRDDQRVDLDEHRLLADERLVELGDERADRPHEVRVHAAVERQAPALVALEAEQRIDVQRRDRLGVLVGDGLDVHPALGGEHDERLLLGPVEDDRGVVLGLDLGRPLDPHLVDREALDVHAEDRAGVLARLAGVLRDLDAAGLAAPPDLAPAP